MVPITKSFRLAALPALAVALVALHAAAAQPADDEARRAVVLDNLQFLFPQLEGLQPKLGPIVASGIPGLEKGTLVLGGKQTQHFLISADNRKLWLTSTEALDVGRSRDELAGARRERAAAEDVAAAERATLLEAALTGPIRGKRSAPITVVEFSDFQCPFCARGARTVDELLAKYPDEVKFAFKHLPLADIHPWAMPAAIAANCAASQNKDAFWTLHDAYFAHQRELTPQNVVDKSREYLEGKDIDMAKFVACAADTDTQEYRESANAVRADFALAQQVGASRTPAFFVNGHFFDGAEPLARFEEVIARLRAR